MKKCVLVISVIFLIFAGRAYAQEMSSIAKSIQYFTQAQSNYEQNQFQQAIDDYTKSIQENPNNYMR